MHILSKCLREYNCHIFVCVYKEVVEYLSSMQFSTVVIANVDVFSSSLDDSHGDKGESTPIVTGDWQQW